MRKYLCALAIGLLCSSLSAQLVINEMGIVEPSTDSTEFVEIYGTPGTDMSLYQLELVNGANGAAYATYALTGTMPGDGFYVVGGSASVPNIDLIIGPATNWIQNGDPDAARIVRISDTAVIDAVGYFSLYTAGAPGLGSLVAGQYEGDPTGCGGDDSIQVMTGVGPSTARNSISIGRYPDGADANNNYLDFVPQYNGRSPGASNTTGISATLPIVESFGGAGATRTWNPHYTDMITTDTAATAVPVSIPDSSDSVTPSSWASVKDNTGGGEQCNLVDFIGQDYYVEALCYCGPISTVSDGAEVGALIGRMMMEQNNSATDAFPIADPYGAYGQAHYGLYMDYVAGTVEARKIFKGQQTVVATSSALSVGWHKLAMNFNGSLVEFSVDDAPLGSLNSETPRYGYVGIGYRETSAATTGSVRNNFDALKIDVPASGVSNWSLY